VEAVIERDAARSALLAAVASENDQFITSTLERAHRIGLTPLEYRGELCGAVCYAVRLVSACTNRA
jgi:hypothetical protein